MSSPTSSIASIVATSPGSARLMTDDHELRVFDEEPLRGKQANVDGWHGYVAAFPAYTIVVREVAEREGWVAVLGHTTDSHLGLPAEEEQELTLIWLAEVSDGLVRSWTLVEDTPHARREWGLRQRAVSFRPPRAASARLLRLCRLFALPDDAPLRIAWLVYRGNPHCGGQGVYTRYLARELTELGHEVTVFSGQPYPELDDPEQLREGPEPRPLPPREPVPGAVAVGVQDHDRRPRSSRSCASPGFPEPYTFSLRARRLLQHRRADFDLIHDNQCLGSGLLGMMRRRLAGARDAAPPDHRRPRPRPRARDERVPPLHAAALVRLPRDADEGRARDPAGRHRVGVEQARHRRADGRARRPAAHRARRRRPEDLPPDARDRACPRPPHDHRRAPTCR